VVTDQESLERRVGEILLAYSGPAMVEEAVEGRDIRVSLLGNETIECLPLLERRGRGRKVVPAPLDNELADRIRWCAFNAYIVAGCRDYARVDLRVPTRGAEPIVVGVQWAGVLVRAGSFVLSAEAAGYSLNSLMHRIVYEASLRYGTSAKWAQWQAPLEHSVVPFQTKQVALR
jgi:D-alanine-D-alanine ligase